MDEVAISARKFVFFGSDRDPVRSTPYTQTTANTNNGFLVKPHKQEKGVKWIRPVRCTSTAQLREKVKEEERKRKQTGPSCPSMPGFQCKTEQPPLWCQTKASSDSNEGRLDGSRRTISQAALTRISSYKLEGCVSIIIKLHTA